MWVRRRPPWGRHVPAEESYYNANYGFSVNLNQTHIPLSSFYFLERHGPSRPAIAGLPTAVQKQLQQLELPPEKMSGRSIAVAVGSRGIASLQEIVRTVCTWLKAQGALPFIVPAMGSHGGGTAEGQRQILAGYGVTREGVGAEVRSCIETVQVAKTPQGFPVFADRLAWESDGVVVINRVKPHSDLSGNIESGMLKMMAIGLGKREGAAEGHKQIWKYGFETTIRAVSGRILESGKVLFGVAIVENESHAVADVRAALPQNIVPVEESAIVLARELMPRLPFAQFDLLIVDEMGKNISGAGMDSKVIGRARRMAPGDGADIGVIYVRDLTDVSGGNATGVGHADLIHERLYRKIDFTKLYANVRSSLNPQGGRLPMYLPSDREALGMALGSLGSPEPEAQRCVWIRNTLTLNRLAISPALRSQIIAPEKWHLSESPFTAQFDPAADLCSPFTSGSA